MAKEELIREHIRMSPEERLCAFAEHSRLLTQLFDAGVEYRQKLKLTADQPADQRKSG